VARQRGESVQAEHGLLGEPTNAQDQRRPRHCGMSMGA
jgi:hypothetical protein